MAVVPSSCGTICRPVREKLRPVARIDIQQGGLPLDPAADKPVMPGCQPLQPRHARGPEHAPLVVALVRHLGPLARSAAASAAQARRGCSRAVSVS